MFPSPIDEKGGDKQIFGSPPPGPKIFKWHHLGGGVDDMQISGSPPLDQNFFKVYFQGRVEEEYVYLGCTLS